MRPSALPLLLASVAVRLRAAHCAEADWLISTPRGTTASVTTTAAGTLLLSNGLTSREFALQPAFGTIDWTLNATTARGGLQSMFRAVMPEGELQLDNTTFDIGGLAQQRTFRAYCNRSEFVLTNGTNPAFRYVSHSVSNPLAPFPWTPGTRHSPPEYQWPPAGKNLAVVFAAPQHTAYRDYKLTVHYEIYDGLPLISKWFTLEVVAGWQEQPAPAAPPPPPAPPTDAAGAAPPPGTTGGWQAAGGAILSTQDGKLNLALSPGLHPGASGQAGARFLTSSSSTGITLAPRSGAGAGEAQTSVGLGLEASALSREDWEIWASCDGGGLYVDTKPPTPGKPPRIGTCAVGDKIAVAHDSATKKASITVNGVAVGWVLYNGTLPLFPRVQILAPAGFGADDLQPAHGMGPPPPPPPPAPPAVDAVINLATVELFGAMPRFGSYPSHGTKQPGSGLGAGGSPPNPLLQAKTDQAHGSACAWLDGEPASKDSIPGCASCQDEGAIEPYLKCSYSLGPVRCPSSNDADDLCLLRLSIHLFLASLVTPLPAPSTCFASTDAVGCLLG